MNSGLTLLSKATPEATDHDQFIPMFEFLEDVYGPIGDEIPLDADFGYWGDETLYQIDEHGWDAYIPNKQIASWSKKSTEILGKFHEYNFIFNEDFSYCTCPNGQKLMRHDLEMTSEGMKTSYHVDHSVICKYCSDHMECCPFKIKREIILFTGNKKTDMYMKMQTEKGRKNYEPRFSKGESPFGLAKEFKGMRQARARGTKNMTTQALLTSIATNIIKINNYTIKNKQNN